jgi:hypothetical protein
LDFISIQRISLTLRRDLLGWLNGEIAVLIVAAIEMPLYLPSAQSIGTGYTLQQGHSMQLDFRVKHPRLYCRGRNPQNLCSFSD